MLGLPTLFRARESASSSPRVLNRTSIRSGDFLRRSVLLHEKLGGRLFRFEQESSGGHFTWERISTSGPLLSTLSDPAKFPTGARVARTGEQTTIFCSAILFGS